MAYILGAERDRDPVRSFQRYRDYLANHRERFPPSAYGLATSDWYFDANSHRCPHDAWLETITITEDSGGERRHVRATQIALRLLGAYHDGQIEFLYPRVFFYKIFSAATLGGHGDWRYDEFRLSDAGHLLHEIEWRDSAVWLIEASDVQYRWLAT